MLGLIGCLSDPSPYPARWDCTACSPCLGGLPVGAAFATFLAFITIPLLISVFILRWREHRAMQAKLRAEARLEDSNRALDEFAQVIAHDLKEPLRGIRNYVSFIGEDHGRHLPGEVNRRLDRIREMAQRLENQVQSLHDFSRLGRTGLDRREVDLQAVLDDTLQGLESTIEATGAKVHVQSRLPSAWCDHSCIGTVFQNLLSNAIKYSDGPPSITIAWRTQVDRILVEVRDEGIGIPRELRGEVFEPFQRLSSDREGSGLGLTLAQRVVQGHGGQLWIEDTEGPGTTFVFGLPTRSPGRPSGSAGSTPFSGA
ncbi:MAG: ATP-binding protein [Myxococcota bacterium]